MARRTFLHVGTPKSGTTYLQSMWWHNRTLFEDQGLHLPGSGVHEHFWASCVVRGREGLLASLPDEASGAWDRVLESVESTSGDVLVSHELFSPAGRPEAERALGQLSERCDELHVVVTARDLARQIPAEWQQRTKHGYGDDLHEFLRAVRRRPRMNFWQVQDVPDLLSRWGAGLPPERVHLVVLPGPGGRRSFLWDETCDLLGVDGREAVPGARAGNESLGLTEAETMRRVSVAVGAEGGLDKRTERLLKGFFAEQILRGDDRERIVLPRWAHRWAVERARSMVTELSGKGYDVRGDLEDLVPPDAPPAGRSPRDVTDSEVAEVAVAALVRFLRHEQGRPGQGRHEQGGGAAAQHEE